MKQQRFSDAFVNVGEVRAQCDTCVDAPVTVFSSSNEVIVNLINVELIKNVSRRCAVPGTIVEYSLTVVNNSTLSINDCVITDEGISCYLKTSNIRLNGRAVPRCENLNSGIIIPEIAPGGRAVITFDAHLTQCAQGVVSNTARLTYRFNDNCQVREAEVFSNTVALEVVEPAIELVKQADRQTIVGDQDIITYTLTAINRGSVPLDDVIISDKLQSRFSYVPNSTIINGCSSVNENIECGVNIGSLAVGESKSVTFSVRANFNNCQCSVEAPLNGGSLNRSFSNNSVINGSNSENQCSNGTAINNSNLNNSFYGGVPVSNSNTGNQCLGSTFSANRRGRAAKNCCKCSSRRI